MPHCHTFELVDRVLRRCRCACGVLGYRLGRRVVAMTCRLELGPRTGARTHCRQDAVYADGDHNHNRCAEHAPATSSTAEGNL